MPLTIYQSSAGSGKTYTLVKEYLQIVLAKPYEYNQVLAITFTNKATEEMKSRIVTALADLVNKEAPKLAEQLAHNFQLNNLDIDIPVQAQKVLDYILHNYSQFAVSTIDSFFQRIIRSFSKELDLLIGYEVEMD